MGFRNSMAGFAPVVVAATVVMGVGVSAAADPNPRAGKGAMAPLDAAAATKQITVKLSPEVAAVAKVDAAAKAALATWETALEKKGFFRLGGTQADPSWPYGQHPGIVLAFAGSKHPVPAMAYARPVHDRCTAADQTKCVPSAKGVRVRIDLDRNKATELTQDVIVRHIARELGRALGLEYAKPPLKCELMLKPAVPAPAGCTRPSKPTAAEVAAVKKIYGIS